MPAKLSDFGDLKISNFETSDKVSLSYWEAGHGEPLIFIPGWSSNGSQYFHILYLMSKKYHVYVLDMRNHGLSQKVSYGNRIARYAADVKEFREHLGIKTAYFTGHSMGASVLWSYIDNYGTSSINKAAFVDQAPSVYSHQGWSEEERQHAGSITNSTERMIDVFTGKAPQNKLVVNTDMISHVMSMDTPYYESVTHFCQSFIHDDIDLMKLVLWDHINSDWRDVIRNKIDIPSAIFTGENSDWKESQIWINSVIPGSKIYMYTKAEHGDHMLMMKNPVKFSMDLDNFLSSQ